jgi:tRNA modification GTPase
MEHNLIRPEIVLAGLPNSGKSSLFNKLLSDDRAIVSSVAGTTRDYLAETVVIEGVKYRLIDTAGIRDSQDAIEAEGIRRTKLKMDQSFYSILLINPLEMVDGFDKLITTDFDLMLFTHADVDGFEAAKIQLQIKYPQLGSIGATNIQEIGQVWEKNLHSLVNKKYLSLIKDKPILLDRHKSLILRFDAVLADYRRLCSTEGDVAILSLELNTLGHCISELIGIVSPDQVLNSIFSNFCIGK